MFQSDDYIAVSEFNLSVTNQSQSFKLFKDLFDFFCWMTWHIDHNSTFCQHISLTQHALPISSFWISSHHCWRKAWHFIRFMFVRITHTAETTSVRTHQPTQFWSDCWNNLVESFFSFHSFFLKIFVSSSFSPVFIQNGTKWAIFPLLSLFSSWLDKSSPISLQFKQFHVKQPLLQKRKMSVTTPSPSKNATGLKPKSPKKADFCVLATVSLRMICKRKNKVGIWSEAEGGRQESSF